MSDLRVEFGHDDLQGLVGSGDGLLRVERVQVPALAGEAAKGVRLAAAEDLLQVADLLLEALVRCLTRKRVA